MEYAKEAAFDAAIKHTERERNEARAEVKRLREALENALAADTESETRHILYVTLTASDE